MTNLRPVDGFYVYSDPAVRDFPVSLRSKKTWEAGEVLARVGGVLSAKHYLTVQCGETDHLLMDSQLVYVNHSCEPNVAFDLSSGDPAEWHVRALKRIEADKDVTFFYPSTEWEMDQAFECRCGTPSCLKVIRGAKHLSLGELELRGYVSPWIRQLTRTEQTGRLGRVDGEEGHEGN